MRSFNKRIFDPLINAFASDFGCNIDSGMDLRSDAQTNFTARRAERFTPLCGAIGNIVIYTFFECFSQFDYIVSVEPNDIPDTRHMTNKQMIFLTIFNPCRIAFISHGIHHGVTPIAIKVVGAKFINYISEINTGAS
ncbi:hypothetical protein EDF84_104239 [Erwinia rhapontici]|nr:hypothetical protein EDF84_104239 [Erwinia rhapontici]